MPLAAACVTLAAVRNETSAGMSLQSLMMTPSAKPYSPWGRESAGTDQHAMTTGHDDKPAHAVFGRGGRGASERSNASGIHPKITKMSKSTRRMVLTRYELAWHGLFSTVLCAAIAALPPAAANALHGRRNHSRTVRSVSSAAPPFSPPSAAPYAA